MSINLSPFRLPNVSQWPPLERSPVKSAQYSPPSSVIGVVERNVCNASRAVMVLQVVPAQIGMVVSPIPYPLLNTLKSTLLLNSQSTSSPGQSTTSNVMQRVNVSGLSPPSKVPDENSTFTFTSSSISKYMLSAPGRHRSSRTFKKLCMIYASSELVTTPSPEISTWKKGIYIGVGDGEGVIPDVGVGNGGVAYNNLLPDAS